MRNVVNVIYRDDSAKRKHGFNIQCFDRHRIFRLKADLHAELRAKTDLDLSEYFTHLNDDLFNNINHWKKEEILFIVENVNASLKWLTNSSQLFRHSMDSIKVKRSAIKDKDPDRLPVKIVCWLQEIGYM